MSYKTLYRTYRPQSFSDMVGQEHIIRTFQNALKKDKISHAYLFTGPRGTGKTSVAKIIAKTVNCKQAPTTEPCNKCDSCLSMTNGFDNDVFEIDAASNNGVDEIREIRDKVKYAPTIGRFKVYIIDEVHMLSTGAFNALLKTLEEPPSHVIFILATTEPHKIPATIISRCQRFDFKSISIKDIVTRIKYILSVENIEIEEKAIYAIAKNAQGGMRDALSLLDQAISYSESIVTEESVHEITGTVSEDKLCQIMSELISLNTAKVIELIDELIAAGKEPLRLIENMIFYLRDLFLINKMKQIDKELILNHSDETCHLAVQFSESNLYEIIAILNKTQYEMRKTNNPRVFIELAIFEMIQLFNRKETRINEPKIKISSQVKVKKKEEKQIIEEEPQEIVNDKEEEPIVEEKVRNETEQKYIDVKEIEEILNNASKEKKLDLVLQWQTLAGTDINLASIEQILLDGQVEAISVDNKIILSYEYDAFCARLYEPETYKNAIHILKEAFQEDYQIIAIPNRIWQNKREEFITQFKKRIKHPRLSPIEEPIIVKKTVNQYEFEPEMVKEAVKIFGDDVIKIK